MAASMARLEELHELLAETFIDELKYYKAEGIPVPAADKSAAIRFLSDNSVVATPKSTEDLDKLREEFKSKPRGSRLAALRAEIGAEDADVTRLQ